MADSIVIDFMADGAVQAMHKDSFPLGFLGEMDITRASEIIFNPTTQLWDIWPRDGEASSFTQAYCGRGFKNYDDARKCEVEWFEKCRLEGVEPMSMQGITIVQILRATNDSYKNHAKKNPD